MLLGLADRVALAGPPGLQDLDGPRVSRLLAGKALTTVASDVVAELVGEQPLGLLAVAPEHDGLRAVRAPGIARVAGHHIDADLRGAKLTQPAAWR